MADKDLDKKPAEQLYANEPDLKSSRYVNISV